MNEYINFANHLLQTIANKRLPIANGLILGNVDPSKYQIMAGVVRGACDIETLIRQTVKEWMAGKKSHPEIIALIKLISVNDPTSTDPQQMHIQAGELKNDE